MLRYIKRHLSGFNSPQGGGSGGGGGGTSTTVQNIPDELKPLASAYTSKAINLSNQPYTPYTGQRYADLNGIQTAGIQGTVNRALNGSQTMNNAESTLNNSFLSGQTNPYLDQMANQALDSVQTRVNSQFGGSNYGTTANQETLGKALGDTAANIYGNAYNTDQSNRLQALQLAPTYGNQAYQDASQLQNAGQIIQDQAQQNLDFQYQNEYQDPQNLPYRQLAAMSGVFGSNLGGSSTTTSNQSSGGGK